ncbi:MAG: hypothetical protein ABIR84_08715 [Candidatus Nitrotoga sp.]
MFRNFLLSSVLLGFVSFSTAEPITFTDPNYSVTAIVGVDETVDSASDTSPLTAIPLNVEKLVSIDTGSAFAHASADLGKLSASANVISSGGIADASSNSRFFGTIDSILGGTYQLAFNFITGDIIDGTDSSASSTLAIIINSNLNDLYNEIFSSSRSLTDFTFSLTPGESALFDITLISNANSTSGSASNAANVDFSINAAVNGVPEPHEGMLLLLGVVVMCSVIRRERIRAVSLLA